MSGPVPKREAERRRRNKPDVQTAAVVVPAVAPPETPAALHAIAAQWFESLKTSGQAQFYEPSDWALAVYDAEAMSRSLAGKKFSAVLFAAVWGAMGDLLTTEGSRRRARLEIQRDTAEQEDPAVTAIAEARKRLRGR